MSGIAAPALVVVTGAGSGIGRATALAFAQRGATAVCVDINEAAAKETATMCGGESTGRVCDVSDAAAVRDLTADVESQLGAVEVLVNNAGVGLGGDFLDHSPEDWAWIRSVNLDGVVNGCHAFGRAMIERRRGQVVNIASGLGYVPSRRTAEYCATKAAVVMLTECLRSDWARHGVGVSVICPGVINTPLLEASRLGGVSAREHDRFLWLFEHGHSPQIVAGAIVRAAANNHGVVPVGLESHLGYYAMKLLPERLRGLVARL